MEYVRIQAKNHLPFAATFASILLKIFQIEKLLVLDLRGSNSAFSLLGKLVHEAVH